MEQDASTITAGGWAFTLCAGILLLLLPRRYALAPLFISGCYMTLGQVLLIGSLHFNILRLLLIFCWARIIAKKEIFSIKLNTIDKIFILWIVISSLINLIRRDWSSEAIISCLGKFYSFVGIYFFIRALISDANDIIPTVRMLGIIIIPLIGFFAMEMTTGKNIFSVFGSVPEFMIIREGRFRCQGAFLHPILAGTFGATCMPLFIGLWANSAHGRLLAASAFLASTFIVISSASSGPLIAYIMGISGFFFWFYKSKMKIFRRCIILLVFFTHLIMKAPVWFLIDRVSNIFGGGGYHRSELINAAIQHLDEWWLMGTSYTAHWMATQLEINPNMVDITNQFLAEGVGGGLLSMCLFIWLIGKCFQIVGTTVHNAMQFSHLERFMAWSLGCTLFAHVMSFFSVSYFDQITIFLFLVVAMISILENPRRDGRDKKSMNLERYRRQDLPASPYLLSSRRRRAGVSQRTGTPVKPSILSPDFKRRS